MARINPIEGKRINLRCAEENDAVFTLSIRNDPKLTRFIPRVDVDQEMQRKWIAKQHIVEDSCFLVYERKNHEPVGTISFYDADWEKGICEMGRYISYGNALENVEAVVLLLDYLFGQEKFSEIILNNDELNKKIIKFWMSFGAEFHETVPMNGWVAAQYRLKRDKYYEKREKIVALL